MKVQTSFTPEQHGFPFANSYVFRPLAFRDSVIKVCAPGSRNQFGLCGGMCFTALDIHNLRANNQSTFVQWGKTAAYLFFRQMESLHWRNLKRYLRYQFMDDTALFGITCVELEKIKDLIRNNRPAATGVMHARQFQPLTHNHQIVITAYETKGTLLILDVYDPNHPNQIATINVDYTNQTIYQNTGESNRGLFLLHYRKKKIPWISLLKQST